MRTAHSTQHGLVGDDVGWGCGCYVEGTIRAWARVLAVDRWYGRKDSVAEAGGAQRKRKLQVEAGCGNAMVGLAYLFLYPVPFALHSSFFILPVPFLHGRATLDGGSSIKVEDSEEGVPCALPVPSSAACSCVQGGGWSPRVPGVTGAPCLMVGHVTWYPTFILSYAPHLGLGFMSG
ncbi:hypothetical protein B0H11DRAFT_2291083 [Mycena galericulata]|nr:hypothetical protein B0H11DRAFT_2291083 [Mycena galericulata]